MKTTDKNFEEMVAKITKKVMDYLTNMDTKPVRIEALNGQPFPELRPPIDLSDMERFIIMGEDFNELTTREKLMVIKASIKTHFRVTGNWVFGLGEIVAYELQFTKKNKDYKVLFSTDGTLVEISMEQYI